MGFAEVLEQVGSLGRFQFLHVLLLSLPIFMMASHNLLQNFVALVPPHHCRAPPPPSPSPAPAPLDLLPALLPFDPQGRPERCRRYAQPQWHLLDWNQSQSLQYWTGAGASPQNQSLQYWTGAGASPQNESQAELQGCGDGWEYQNSERSSTVISEWDLVCEHRSLKQMGQTIYMGGVLVGSTVFGGLSDRFGRRVLLLWSHLQMAVAGTCAAFSPSFPWFCFFRFLTGMALSGIILNSFSLIVEWIPTRVRTVVGTGTGYCYTLGQLILAGLAYWIRDWRWLTLAVSLPFYLSFLYSWWFPESARWLVLNGKTDSAVNQLQRVARINGRAEEGKKINTETLRCSMQKEISSLKSSYSPLDLVRTPALRRITCCLIFVWFSTSFAYYGLSMDLQKFGVDIYMIQVIFGAVDIPAKLVSNMVMSLAGRRVTQSGSLILSGVTILTNIFIPHDFQKVRTAVAVFGKGCLASSFMCCYLYSGELYPTLIRQNGMGLVSTMARLGAMVAPLVLLTGEFVSFLPMLIYGGAPMISGVIAVFLPETLNVPLPDTIEEVELRVCGPSAAEEPPKTEEASLGEVNHSLLKETL
ncbi:solute carrier family 22 member 6-like [Acipenser ruthenus]|uniref:solute carrier family 22 member 6-like n=2 Tax=Acipenser ruthenus TaxID=7906 RepID=UPI00145A24FF|nr:solute carrier family 22 member 6-like [Acipenser ruthenus]